MGRKSNAKQQQQQLLQRDSLRPKRRATNAHIFRYLQTRNPTKLEEDDLKRALEASLEECPDFWPEDSASCSSSEQSNATSAASSSSSSGGGVTNHHRKTSKINNNNNNNNKRRSKSMQPNHLKHQHNHQSYMHNPYHHLIQNSQTNNNSTHPNTLTANSNCCPMSTVHNRYKPVAKKNIYNEADFFHDGIMEYIEYELQKRWTKV